MEDVSIPIDDVVLPGKLTVPMGASGVVVFAHGSGSSRHSPRNNYVADVITNRGLGALLFDLLTETEDQHRENRFDIDLLTDRLVGVTDWLLSRPRTGSQPIGYFGASTGAAAALRGATRRPAAVNAVVSRGGRVDMAEDVLSVIDTPTLFIVGGDDEQIRTLNREAFVTLQCEKAFEVVPGAGHLFEGPGELEHVAEVVTDWFETHLTKTTRPT